MTQLVEIDCDECNGTGKQVKMELCPFCEGEKLVYRSASLALILSPGRQTQTKTICTHCLGQGEVETYPDCPECGGTGKKFETF